MTPQKLQSTLILLLIAGSVTVASLANASPRVQVGKIGYAGNGCPNGSANVKFNKNKNHLTVNTRAFYASANSKRKGKTFKRIKCDLSVALKAPYGYKVRIKKAVYKTYVGLPYGASGTFNREYFFAGKQGPRLRTQWKGKTYKLMTQVDQPFKYSQWSRCGESTILRMKASMNVRSKHGYASLGILPKTHRRNSNWSYTLEYRRCK
ncbi:MAG: DUF4360 domain-containing protein [Thiotrichaceae bacterium]|nr:DUF4360 domain-containing protein [Thiotrichaceae bacterium]